MENEFGEYIPRGGIHWLGEGAGLYGVYWGTAGRPFAHSEPDCSGCEEKKGGSGAELAGRALLVGLISPGRVFGGVKRLPALERSWSDMDGCDIELPKLMA